VKASLWIRGPLPGLNDIIEACKGAGGVGRYYARMKREWTEIVWAEVTSARLPRFPGGVYVSFVWHEADQRRDPDNVAAGKKFVLDGLVRAGVIKNDKAEVLLGLRDHFDWEAPVAHRGVSFEVSTEGWSK
jgi:hypothetical protein